MGAVGGCSPTILEMSQGLLGKEQVSPIAPPASWLSLGTSSIHHQSMAPFQDHWTLNLQNHDLI